MFAFFLSSGLFLGWSLGANDAANVFGTAVGSRMIRFSTAAIYFSVFFIIGSVVSGAGASDTLGKLGSVNAIAGAFGSYSLGANNIANVMGVFVPVSPFSDITFMGIFRLTSAQQLFFIGAVAVSIGVCTYSKRVMMTIGEGIMELSPVAALVVVGAHAIVLFLFASQGLEQFLINHGLPSIPLVPVSSSQAPLKIVSPETAPAHHCKRYRDT